MGDAEKLKITNLDPGELERLVDAQNEIFADYIIPVTSSPQFLREFMRSIGGKAENVLIAADGEDIIGYVNPVIDDKEVWIGGLGVVPAFRRRGVGRRLMIAAEDFARDRGAEESILEVIEGNLPALALYERLGYSAKGRKYLSAEGRAVQFAGFGLMPSRVRFDDVLDLHRTVYCDACWQRRKVSALTESERTCETYSVDGGFVMLRRVGTTGHIPFIGVLPEKRGLGIGTSLTKFALSRLWELGAFKVAIYNVNDDRPTRRMLDKFDFAVTLKQIEMRKAI
ncbi:MAG: GNAT family N-acetyltransferase [Methanobacteriota archaeon]|nr:MAG: GNAT family N-acetyltransferase [Euryarchaeota archaeon]